MNGNVGIIVFTRGTHGCLSRHLAWKHSIHKAFRAFLSPPHTHTAVRTYALAHTHTHTRTIGEGCTTPLPAARRLTPVTYSEFRCRDEGLPRPALRFSLSLSRLVIIPTLENNSSLHYARKRRDSRAPRFRSPSTLSSTNDETSLMSEVSRIFILYYSRAVQVSRLNTCPWIP